MMVQVIAKLAKLVSIKDLYFCSAEAVRLLTGKAPREVEVDLSYSAEGRLVGPKTIEAVVSFLVKVNGLEKATIAKIACKVRVLYQIEDAAALQGIELTDEVVSAFAQTNGTYNAFPYFREYLQGTCGRLGIPPVIAPALMASELFDRLRDDGTPKKDNVIPLKRVRASGA
ncbi:MAG: hypothetical protein ACRERC_06475 [Candidatus Binatia bacterium]